MPVVSIRHRTSYRYRRPVAFGEHRMMLRPLEALDQQLLSTDLEISPEPSLLRHLEDVSGASVGVARFAARADHLVVESRVRLLHTPREPQALDDAAVLGGATTLYAPEEIAELAASIRRRHGQGDAVEAWTRRFVRPAGPTRLMDLLADMTHAIRESSTYALRLQGPPQAPAETLARGTGSCRDFALLMIEAARSLGLAARFVSGYVYSCSKKSGRTGGGHTHAWVRVYTPGCGWVDFDPTNGIVGNADLIRVAVVAEPRLATPLHGAWRGGRDDYLGMDITVDVDVEDDVEMQRASHLRVANAR
ncbi:MAG: transglutaminase family protein [Phenylobacterium sp.]|nr:MAG: transglutaminase family protein [Phenylobacterium sp.]